jgi:hypothetical protein
MTISIAKINGLELLQEALNPKRIKKDISLGVGRAALAIHSELRLAVQRHYRAPGDLDSVLIGKAAKVQDFGRNVIKGELSYSQPSINLSRYMNRLRPIKGNIGPGDKVHDGWVHFVEIIRGRIKVVYGKTNRGGFTSRDAKGNLVRRYRQDSEGNNIGPGRSIMLERQSSKRLPVKPLFGPTLAALAMHMYDHDTKVHQAKKKAEQIIIDSIDFL